MADRALKAYEVQDSSEGHACVVFCTNSATARRRGADELGTDWEGIEHCRRAPHLDLYSPGPVPPLVLIEHGWWFECSHCGRRVSNDMEDEIFDDGLEPADFVPRQDGTVGVYCSASCECFGHMEKRGREEAEEALREVFEAKFPGATVVRIHCYDGPKLTAPEDMTRGGGKYVVTFTFPGGKYSSMWNFGDDRCWVPNGDQDAYKEWREVLQ